MAKGRSDHDGLGTASPIGDVPLERLVFLALALLLFQCLLGSLVLPFRSKTLRDQVGSLQ